MGLMHCSLTPTLQSNLVKQVSGHSTSLILPPYTDVSVRHLITTPLNRPPRATLAWRLPYSSKRNSLR